LKIQRHFPITGRRSEEIIAFHIGEAIDVGQFIGQAKVLATRLPDHRYVINLFSNRFEYLLGFCASVIAGQCTLMPPNRLDSTLDELTQLYPDSYLLGDAEVSDEAENGKSSDGGAERVSSDQVPLIPSDQLCAIAFTSGSTGTPNPNLKYWDTLRVGTLGNAALLLKDNCQRLNIVATVPPQHMWGLETSILFPLFANVAISDRTPFYPQDIVEALESIPTPRALVSSPVHLDGLLKSGVSFSGLDRVFSATAPMSSDLARLLEKHFETEVFEVFGCSESGILAGRYTAIETLWQLSDLFKLEIKPDGVLIKARHLPCEVTIQDIIEKIDESHFKWLGRHQDMINIAGKRGSLSDLNRRLLAIPGVIDGVVFKPRSGSERLAAFVVAPTLKPSDILDALRPVVESVFLPRPVLMISTLPRQETGKLANSAVMEMFEDVLRAKQAKPETQ
jgi:acyl-coenzyme A synthetase/AMP-(fatty) acid ligase